jgi:hypothetical protein
MPWSRRASPLFIHLDCPFLKQPFRYVAAVFIALAPFPKGNRTSKCFFGKTQASKLHFELRCSCTNRLRRLSPVRISASAPGKQNQWFRHPKDHTPLGLTPQLESRSYLARGNGAVAFGRAFLETPLASMWPLNSKSC